MQDYIQALRSKDDTPGSLLSMTRDAEAAILDKYRAEVTAMQQGTVPNLAAVRYRTFIDKTKLRLYRPLHTPTSESPFKVLTSSITLIADFNSVCVNILMICIP